MIFKKVIWVVNLAVVITSGGLSSNYTFVSVHDDGTAPLFIDYYIDFGEEGNR